MSLREINRPDRRRDRREGDGPSRERESPNPWDGASGCRFRLRCPTGPGALRRRYARSATSS